MSDPYEDLLRGKLTFNTACGFETSDSDVHHMTITLREPCSCGCAVGVVRPTNGQDVVRCADCDRYAYCRPRSESGRPVASTRSNAAIKPSVKARILATYGHQCIACGRSPVVHGVVLDIDHIIPVALAAEQGIPDDLVRSEANLAPLCAECNRGKQADIDAISIQLVYRVLVLKGVTD